MEVLLPSPASTAGGPLTLQLPLNFVSAPPVDGIMVYAALDPSASALAVLAASAHAQAGTPWLSGTGYSVSLALPPGSAMASALGNASLHTLMLPVVLALQAPNTSDPSLGLIPYAMPEACGAGSLGGGFNATTVALYTPPAAPALAWPSPGLLSLAVPPAAAAGAPLPLPLPLQWAASAAALPAWRAEVAGAGFGNATLSLCGLVTLDIVASLDPTLPMPGAAALCALLSCTPPPAALAAPVRLSTLRLNFSTSPSTFLTTLALSLQGLWGAVDAADTAAGLRYGTGPGQQPRPNATLQLGLVGCSDAWGQRCPDANFTLVLLRPPVSQRRLLWAVPGGSTASSSAAVSTLPMLVLPTPSSSAAAAASALTLTVAALALEEAGAASVIAAPPSNLTLLAAACMPLDGRGSDVTPLLAPSSPALPLPFSLAAVNAAIPNPCAAQGYSGASAWVSWASIDGASWAGGARPAATLNFTLASGDPVAAYLAAYLARYPSASPSPTPSNSPSPSVSRTPSGTPSFPSASPSLTPGASPTPSATPSGSGSGSGSASTSPSATPSPSPAPMYPTFLLNMSLWGLDMPNYGTLIPALRALGTPTALYPWAALLPSPGDFRVLSASTSSSVSTAQGVASAGAQGSPLQVLFSTSPPPPVLSWATASVGIQVSAVGETLPISLRVGVRSSTALAPAAPVLLRASLVQGCGWGGHSASLASNTNCAHPGRIFAPIYDALGGPWAATGVLEAGAVTAYLTLQLRTGDPWGLLAAVNPASATPAALNFTFSLSAFAPALLLPAHIEWSSAAGLGASPALANATFTSPYAPLPTSATFSPLTGQPTNRTFSLLITLPDFGSTYASNLASALAAPAPTVQRLFTPTSAGGAGLGLGVAVRAVSSRILSAAAPANAPTLPPALSGTPSALNAFGSPAAAGAGVFPADPASLPPMVAAAFFNPLATTPDANVAPSGVASWPLTGTGGAPLFNLQWEGLLTPPPPTPAPIARNFPSFFVPLAQPTPNPLLRLAAGFDVLTLSTGIGPPPPPPPPPHRPPQHHCHCQQQLGSYCQCRAQRQRQRPRLPLPTPRSHAQRVSVHKALPHPHLHALPLLLCHHLCHQRSGGRGLPQECARRHPHWHCLAQHHPLPQHQRAGQWQCAWQ